MSAPRIAAVHDLSCFGRCSLTIAIPVLSAMGCQCCPLPTALLSTHTAYPDGSFLELTAEMDRIADHWAALGVSFDAIYSGFLGSAAQVGTVERLIRRFRRPGLLVVIDPVMGDHGKPYRTCTPELCRSQIALAEQADLITPNLTEAALLLDRPYEALLDTDPTDIVTALSMDGRRSVVLTGYASAEGLTGALCFDRNTGRLQAVQTPREPASFHGTGDLFTSVLTGALALGASPAAAAQQAAEFVRVCVARTAALGTSVKEGVEFEPLLGLLTPQIDAT